MKYRVTQSGLIVPSHLGIVRPSHGPWFHVPSRTKREDHRRWEEAKRKWKPHLITVSNVHAKVTGDNISTSLNATFGVQPTVGNYVFLVVSGFRAAAAPFGATAVSDNQTGNTWNRDISQYTSPSQAAIFSAKVVGTGATFTVTLATSGASTYAVCTIFECSGLAASTPLDQTQFLSNGTTQGNTITANSQNALANELVLAAFTIDGTLNPEGISDPASSSYSSLYVEQNGAAREPGQGSYKIVSSLETSSATWTWNANARNNVSVLATYKAASSASVVPRRLLLGVGPSSDDEMPLAFSIPLLAEGWLRRRKNHIRQCERRGH